MFVRISFCLALSLFAVALVDGENEQKPKEVKSQPIVSAPIEVQEAKDKKFYSWGDNNKRSDDEAMEKRKFYAWAGKRSDQEQSGGESEEVGEISKRKFYQWAGKRADNNKRRFYAWAGKRSESGGMDDEDQHEEMEKRKFYAWAGKRSAETDSNELAMLKRKFYAWAGKRSGEHEEEKRKFYAWAG